MAVGADIVQEVGPLDELHGEEPPVPVREELPEADEIGMDHLLEGAELLLESVEGGGVEVLDGLEGDDQVALAVEGLVDDPHAAGPEPPPDFEAVGPGEFVRG